MLFKNLSDRAGTFPSVRKFNHSGSVKRPSAYEQTDNSANSLLIRLYTFVWQQYFSTWRAAWPATATRTKFSTTIDLVKYILVFEVSWETRANCVWGGIKVKSGICRDADGKRIGQSKSFYHHRHLASCPRASLFAAWNSSFESTPGRPGVLLNNAYIS